MSVSVTVSDKNRDVRLNTDGEYHSVLWSPTAAKVSGGNALVLPESIKVDPGHYSLQIQARGYWDIARPPQSDIGFCLMRYPFDSEDNGTAYSTIDPFKCPDPPIKVGTLTCRLWYDTKGGSITIYADGTYSLSAGFDLACRGGAVWIRHRVAKFLPVSA